ncbi:MAG: helix-turn-helix transcriptional regulator [Eggerthellaceae bacterium]|jgi:DNA-binding CsgD family transcriptional regulator
MARSSLGFMQLAIIVGYGMFYAWYLLAFFGLFMFTPAALSFAGLHVGQVVFFAASIVASAFVLARFRSAGAVSFSFARLVLPAFARAGSAPNRKHSAGDGATRGRGASKTRAGGSLAGRSSSTVSANASENARSAGGEAERPASKGDVSAGIVARLRSVLALVAAVIGGAAAPCALFAANTADTALGVLYVACAASGALVALGYFSWDDLCKRGYLKRNTFAHAIIFSLGGALFCGVMVTLDPAIITASAIAFYTISLMLLLFISVRAEVSVASPVADTVSFFRTTYHLDVITCVITIAFGFSFMLLYRSIGVGLAVVMGAAIALDFLLTMALGKNRYVPFVGTVRFCLAVAAVMLILFAAPGTLAKTIALSVVVAVWFLYRTVNGGALMELASSKKLSLQYTAGRGKLCGNIGFCAGLALGIVVMEAVPGGVNGLDAYADAAVYTALALVAAIVLAALFLLPFDNESCAPGLRTLIPAPVAEATQGARTQGDADDAGAAALVARYRLSPRESDVLRYLIRGRNAKHIAEKLCISESTAKTHIASIYRKTDVHSQQELLDRLEETAAAAGCASRDDADAA